MNDEQFFLANAYLDGELTAEERRIAEADPEVMAEVEQLRALQSELRDVPAATSTARDAAIAAAMAEFSAASQPADVEDDERTTSPPVVPFRPRPAYGKYLGVAAAVVAVGVLGVVVSQADLGGDDDDSGGGDSAAAEVAADDRLTEGADEAGGEDTGDSEMAEAAEAAPAADGGDDAGAESTAEMSVDDMAADMAEEDVAEEADRAGDDDAAAQDAGDEETAATLGPAPTVPADFDPDEPIVDEFDLAIYGAYLREERERGTLGSTPNTPCSGDYEILRRASITGPADEIVPVFVAVDDLDGTTLAIDEDACAVLLDTATR